MPYITTSNSKKIINKINVDVFDNVVENIYKWEIYFFNKREVNLLKGIRELYRNPENFVLNYYQPIEVVDTYRFLYPEVAPAYHNDPKCERLNSNFRNTEIPIQIREKGKDEVIKFREWYKNTGFNIEDVKDYIYKLQVKFPYIGEISQSSIEYNNSGIIEKENYSLPELELKIDTLLREASQYFNDNPNLQDLIRKYQKWTFLAYVYGDLKNNESKLNDNDLKEFLRNYDEKFKKPVKLLLVEYYRVKFNPEMTFEGHILTRLGFKICKQCLGNNNDVLFSPLVEINPDSENKMDNNIEK